MPEWQHLTALQPLCGNLPLHTTPIFSHCLESPKKAFMEGPSISCFHNYQSIFIFQCLQRGVKWFALHVSELESTLSS